MSSGKALVLGDDTRSFLAIIRSLGRRGVTVHVAPARWSGPALKSRYIAASHLLPHWVDDGADWITALAALLERERFDVVIPCDETALLPLARNRTRFAALARLAIPDDASIAVLFDKHETRVLAQRLGIPVAPGRVPDPSDTAAGVAAAFGLPLMVKPRRSFAFEGLDRRRPVRRIAGLAELEAVLPELDPADDLFEGFVPGTGLGVSVLASHGKVLQAFQHHRVREDASGSYYRVSAALAPAYLQACAAMVGALDYTGVAMFEFRADAASGQWVLLEVNARPWGSLPLAVNAGVDFPWCWFRLLAAGEVVPEMPYRVGLYGRNLVPDLRAILREARGRPGLAACRIAEFGRVLIGRERYDVLVADDPMPGLTELARLAPSALRHAGEALPGARAIQRYRARRIAAALRGLPAPRLLFVCQGNICRSPFAAAQMRRLAGAGMDIGSAGMLPRPGRAVPEAGQRAALAHGCDLSAHRSIFLTRSMAEAATLIVVFDRINLTWLADRYPGLATPVILLGRIAGAGELEDPVDGDDAVFAAAYAKIARWVDALAAMSRR